MDLPQQLTQCTQEAPVCNAADGIQTMNRLTKNYVPSFSMQAVHDFQGCLLFNIAPAGCCSQRQAGHCPRPALPFLLAVPAAEQQPAQADNAWLLCSGSRVAWLKEAIQYLMWGRTCSESGSASSTGQGGIRGCPLRSSFSWLRALHLLKVYVSSACTLFNWSLCSRILMVSKRGKAYLEHPRPINADHQMHQNKAPELEVLILCCTKGLKLLL